MKSLTGVSSRRGMSVLAAVVLAAILAVIGFGAEQVRTSYLASANARGAALAASADLAMLDGATSVQGTGSAGTANQPAGTTASTAEQDVAKACQQVIAAAQASHQATPPATETGTDTLTDKCVAAVPDSSLATKYRCVGKTAIVTVSQGGATVVRTAANASVAAGTCDTISCSGSTATTQTCIAAKTLGFSGANNGINAPLSGEKTFTLSNDPGNGTTVHGADPTTQRILNEAFGSNVGDGSTGVPVDSSGNLSLPASDQLAQLASGSSDPTTLSQQQEATQAAVKLDSSLSSNVGTVAPNNSNGNNQNQNGQTQNGQGPANKSNNTFGSPGNSGNQGSTMGQGQGSGGSSNPLMQILKSLLGLGGGSGSSMACTSDQNTYNQQLQQYQSNMTQYNYQLQQYNYQVQQCQTMQAQGISCTTPVQPTPPQQPCYDPNSSSQCTSNQPSQPDASSCTTGSWKPIYSGACIVNWQCVSGSGTGQQPTATLSCQPQVADASSTLAIAFGCTNATRSAGSGFDTGGALSGTSTPVLSAPANATSATYRLTCINGSLTASQQCTIQIARPHIVLVATPASVVASSTAAIGWVTSGMQACTISSPQQADFTARNAENRSINGVATTSPIIASTEFVLTCETVGGSTKAASTTVTVQQ